LKIGVDHFYITDNGSEPHLNETIKDFIDKNIITYKYDTRDKPQINVYNECIQNYQNESTWIAFFDSDEFLVLKKDSSIRIFLSRYENNTIGSLSICWYLFGSNGHTEKQQSVISSYTKRVPNSCHYKVIVRPTRVKQFAIHEVISHKNHYITVDELKRKVSGPYTVWQATEFSQLNHYVLRSLQDYKDKMIRGGGNTRLSKDLNFFAYVNNNSTVEDTCILNKL
jgi:hypothetical protein